MNVSGSPYVNDIRPVPGDLVEVVRDGHGGIVRTIGLCLSHVKDDVDNPSLNRRESYDGTVYEFMMAGPHAAGRLLRSWVVVGGTGEKIWRLEVLERGKK